jgi:nucleoside-diphosphate-sugar epimerase
MPAMAVLMKNHLGERGKKIRTMTVPDFVVKIGARFNSAMRVLVTMIGTKYAHTNAKAKTVLGWEPRPVAQTVIDTTDYLLDSGLA